MSVSLRDEVLMSSRGEVCTGISHLLVWPQVVVGTNKRLAHGDTVGTGWVPTVGDQLVLT